MTIVQAEDVAVVPHHGPNCAERRPGYELDIMSAAYSSHLKDLIANGALRSSRYQRRPDDRRHPRRVECERLRLVAALGQADLEQSEFDPLFVVEV